MKTEGKGWKGVIVAEAATVFKRNRTKFVESEPGLSCLDAMHWVEAEVKKLLAEEEQMSQAMVFAVDYEDISFDLLPSSWGSSPNWIPSGAEAYG